MKIITLIQTKRHIKMVGQDKLRIELKYGELNQRCWQLKTFSMNLHKQNCNHNKIRLRA